MHEFFGKLWIFEAGKINLREPGHTKQPKAAKKKILFAIKEHVTSTFYSHQP